jgi:hypothetical protein
MKHALKLRRSCNLGRWQTHLATADEVSDEQRITRCNEWTIELIIQESGFVYYAQVIQPNVFIGKKKDAQYA